ncbi:Rpn family recombination-promoting nuclease/putative transposase [Lysinibacillus sp. NPDC096212]|uniref:Rpn family recombination-promoting nuclease/putative transposase n=1 Tax=Lysinibacillus sp. NPDC096212 TaxID=3364135 RepID=UPI00382948B2
MGNVIHQLNGVRIVSGLVTDYLLAKENGFDVGKQEIGGEYKDDKQSRLDIVVKTQDQQMINIEIQLSNQHDMFKRTLFYWAQLYTSQLQKGMGYHKLLPTITINICNFTLFPQSAYYHSTFHLYEDKTLKRLVIQDDALEVHFIEKNKFLEQWHRGFLKPLDDILARWLLLLGMVDARKKKVYKKIYREMEELAMKDEHLLQAFNVWEELSLSQEDVIAYQSRLKYILDEEAKLEDVKHMAEQQGIEKEKEETANKLLANGMDIDFIHKITDLSVERIEEIKERLIQRREDK